MNRIRIGWMVALVGLVVLAAGLQACQQDDVECDGEDHRPPLPAAANACHEAYQLYIRTNECIDGFYDEESNKGLNGRNAQLAYHYAMADHATAAQISECEGQATAHEETIAEEDCAAASRDCGPAPDDDNPCHDYYTELLAYRLRCSPETFGDEGTTSYDAAFDANMAMASYASTSEQGSVCAGIAYYRDANDDGICYR